MSSTSHLPVEYTRDGSRAWVHSVIFASASAACLGFIIGVIFTLVVA